MTELHFDCGHCRFYEPCECDSDKEPHGHCFVNPPKTFWLPQRIWGAEATETLELERVEGVAEVFADRPSCRFFILKDSK